MPIEGSCLCGAVTYEITGDFVVAGHCHCSVCRKAHGAAFATWGILRDPKQFRWTSGEELLKGHESSPGRKRAFCGTCGSPLAMVASASGEVHEVVLASIDGDPPMHPREHIFVGSKATWHEITDDLPQHRDFPPGMQP